MSKAQHTLFLPGFSSCNEGMKDTDSQVQNMFSSLVFFSTFFFFFLLLAFSRKSLPIHHFCATFFFCLLINFDSFSLFYFFLIYLFILILVHKLRVLIRHPSPFRLVCFSSSISIQRMLMKYPHPLWPGSTKNIPK